MGFSFAAAQQLSKLWQGPSERWYAWRASRAMLEWYRAERASEPALPGRTLYERIMIDRGGLDRRVALQVLRRAEQSFCEWPVERELRYRDLVLFVLVDRYLRIHGNRAGTQTNMATVVSRVIPEDL